MKLDISTIQFAGSKGFFAAKFARVVFGFAINYWLQLYLIKQYPGEINAWLQVSLRTLDLNPILATGFGVLSLSSGIRASQFIGNFKAEYLASLLIRLFLFVLAILMLTTAFDSQITDAFGPLYHCVIALSAVSIVSGDATNFAYADHDEDTYEKSHLAVQVGGCIVLLFMLLRYQLEPVTVCLLAFGFIVLPKYIIDLRFMLIMYSRLLGKRNIWSFFSASICSSRLVGKSLMVSLLGVVAYLNWSIDVILVRLLGTPQEVNQLALVMGISSMPSVALSFIVGKLQIRWINLPLNLVIKDMKIIVLLSFVCSLLLLPASSMLLNIADAQISTKSQVAMILSASLLSLLSNIGVLIGTYMNSRFMLTRQVAIAGLLALPCNLFLSVKLYHVIGVSGVILGTIAGQLLTIMGNLSTSSLIRSPFVLCFKPAGLDSKTEL